MKPAAKARPKRGTTVGELEKALGAKVQAVIGKRPKRGRDEDIYTVLRNADPRVRAHADAIRQRQSAEYVAAHANVVKASEKLTRSFKKWQDDDVSDFYEAVARDVFRIDRLVRRMHRLGKQKARV